MDDAVSRVARHTLVGHYLTEVSLLAKALCPEAQVEATTERYEDVTRTIESFRDRCDSIRPRQTLPV